LKSPDGASQDAVPDMTSAESSELAAKRIETEREETRIGVFILHSRLHEQRKAHEYWC
jgi:hypothetical protein